MFLINFKSIHRNLVIDSPLHKWFRLFVALPFVNPADLTKSYNAILDIKPSLPIEQVNY